MGKLIGRGLHQHLNNIMETGTKIALGLLTATGIGAIIYFGFMNNTDKIVDAVLAKAPEASRTANRPLLKKMSKKEITNFKNIIDKAEKDWTTGDREMAIGLMKKYKLKIGS